MPRSRPVECDLCWETSATRKVLAFSLIVGAVVDGRQTTRGAGAIHLCEECWKQTGAKRLHPRERKTRKAAVFERKNRVPNPATM